MSDGFKEVFVFNIGESIKLDVDMVKMSLNVFI